MRFIANCDTGEIKQARVFVESVVVQSEEHIIFGFFEEFGELANALSPVELDYRHLEVGPISAEQTRALSEDIFRCG